jgi:hypothetical protein
MLRVIQNDSAVATIYLSDEKDPNHRANQPWILRIEPFRSVEGFATQKEAKQKAANLFGVRTVFMKVG